MDDASRSSRLDRFLQMFWQDVGRGAHLPVDDYVAEFPELEDEVREEYAAAETEAGRVIGPLPEGATPLRRRRIGRYEVWGQLAKGGQGRILLGWDAELERRVVLKTPKGQEFVDRDATLVRLQREARIGSRLYHDGICPVLDVVHEGDSLFVVMPFIEGVNLHELIRQAREVARESFPQRFGAGLLWQVYDRLSCGGAGVHPRDDSSRATVSTSGSGERGDLRPVVRLVEDIAHAVGAAHEQGIVHRDLKPSNVILRPGFTPTVLDFGLALDLNEDLVARLTGEGEVLGTPAYMAPEQIEAQGHEVGPRTDVYALGVILYEVLTLRRPFHEKSMSVLAARITKGAPRGPRRIDPAIPASLEAVCMKAMDVDPGRRYGSMLEFAADLRRVRMLQPTVATPPTTVGRILRVVRHNRVAAVAIVLVVALATALALDWKRESHRRRIVDLWTRHQKTPGVLTATERAELRRALELESWQLDDISRDPARALEAISSYFLDSSRGRDTVLPLSPVHTIVTNPPTFRFRVGPGALGGLRLDLDGARRVLDAAPAAGDVAEFTPPQPLSLGVHRWSVAVVDAAGDPPAKALSFRIATPEQLAAVRAAAPRFGDAAVDRHSELTAMLRAGFGAAALRLLDELSDEQRRALPCGGRLLRLWALASTNRRREFVELQVDLLEGK